MPWLEVSLRVSREVVPAAEEALQSLGALSVTLQDDADVPVLEPGPGSTPLWPVVQVRGLFEHTADRAAILVGLQQLPGADRSAHVEWREVGDEDWARAWMDRFEPMRFGRRLWVVPSGMSIPPGPDQVAVRLDPGLAFGTGTHPTTALCLEWLDAHDVNEQRVIDYGCGSGILGIAAALLGAAWVDCVDNDPQALTATQENARNNSVQSVIHCLDTDQSLDLKADILLANILANPLISLESLFKNLLKPNGVAILSGILIEQRESVIEAYEPDFTLAGGADQGDWSRLDFKLKSVYGYI